MPKLREGTLAKQRDLQRLLRKAKIEGRGRCIKSVRRWDRIADSVLEAQSNGGKANHL